MSEAQFIPGKPYDHFFFLWWFKITTESCETTGILRNDRYSSRFFTSCNEAKLAQTRPKVCVACENVDVARLKVYVACVKGWVSIF